MRDAATDRPEISYLEIPDAPRALRDRRQCGPAELLGVDQLAPGRQWPDVELAVALGDPAQLDARDVDHDRWACDPQLHHGNERLSARDRLRVGLRQELERVVEIGRTRVPCCRWDHAAPTAR